MPNITPARLSLALAALLACKSDTGDTASDTDPSAGNTTSTSLTGTDGDTSTSDTSTSTTEGASTTPEPTTLASSSTTHDTPDHGTTSTGVVSCGGGWCASKDSLNIIIMDNHEPPHELVIPAFDADACVERTYEFTGAADHTHTVTFTPTDFAVIDSGGQIEIESSEAQGHTHIVWSDCE